MRYAQIRNMDISNGENLGVSLFVQGCQFHCKNCFNPETWNFNGGKEWTEEIKNKFFGLINRPYIKRVSILGGEPLADNNVFDVLNLILEIKNKFPDKSIWLYTGYTWKNLIDEFTIYQYTPFASGADEWLTRYEIIENVDVVVDGRYIDEQKDLTLKWCGSYNQRVIDAKRSLNEHKIVLYNN